MGLIRKILNYALTVIIIFLILCPIIWLIMASFKDRVDLLSTKPIFFFKPTYENYKEAVLSKEFYRVILNSIFVSTCSSILIILAALPLSFLISRKKIKNSFIIFFSILTTRMAPSIAIALPLFWIFSRLNLIDSYTALIIIHFVLNFAIGIWILRIVFDRIPSQIEEAAQIDGLSFFSAFIRLIIPLSSRGILLAFIILFIFSWNEMLISFIISGFDKRPITTAILGLITPHGTYWGQIAAISTISLVPIILFILGWRKTISHIS